MSISHPQVTEQDRAVLDGSGESRRIFEPPESFVVRAIGRNKLIVLVVAIACALIGAGIGVVRGKNTYSASASLQIGQVNPNSPGFYSYVASSAALAAAFSRAISAEPVLSVVEDKLKLTQAESVNRLSATPIPQAPALRVTATGPTAATAVQLANVAANALIAYESQSNSANPEAASLLHEYRQASLQLQHEVARFARSAQIDRSRHMRGSTLADALAPVEASRNAAAIRLRALGNSYTASVASQAPRSGLVSLLAGATSASSNRNSKAALFGFAGLMVGLVLGCAIATVRERRRKRRDGPGMPMGTLRSEPA